MRMFPKEADPQTNGSEAACIPEAPRGGIGGHQPDVAIINRDLHPGRHLHHH